MKRSENLIHPIPSIGLGRHTTTHQEDKQHQRIPLRHCCENLGTIDYYCSSLDYCNSVCIGLPVNRLQQLQLLHNSAARRFIRQAKRYTSITPILNELHWLPINKRCQFKILLLTFKSLNACAPKYLCDMLNVYMPNRALRSTAFTSLVPYRNRSIRLGKCLFGTSAAKLWNELPRNIQRADSITMFKKLL